MDISFKMNHIIVAVLILFYNVSFNDADTAEEADKLHHYYSRYMLYHFKLIGKYFENTFGVPPDHKVADVPKDNDRTNDIDVFDKQLRSQRYIVLFMLKKLKDISPNSKLPHDLMQINLYLNSPRGNAKIPIDVRLPQGKKYTERSCIRGYGYYFKIIIGSLCMFINTRGCGVAELNTSRDKNQTDDRFKDINSLLPETYPPEKTDNLELLATLDQNQKRLEEIFRSTARDKSYMNFHPEQLLFRVLMVPKNVTVSITGKTIDFLSGDNTYYGQDKSQMVRSVYTNYKLTNGLDATVYHLYTKMWTIIDQNFVISFQQHVLAAVLYPVFMCVSTYLTGFKKLYYPGDNKFGNVKTRVHLYEPQLNSDGINLLGHIEQLIEYRIFPKSVQQHLDDVLGELRDYINCPKEILHLISDRLLINKLFVKCSKPMELNNIKYDIGIESFDISKKEHMENLVDVITNQINDVGSYVESLNKHKDAFKIVLETFCDHENMFKDPPLNLFDMKKIGHVTYQGNTYKSKTDDTSTHQLVNI